MKNTTRILVGALGFCAMALNLSAETLTPEQALDRVMESANAPEIKALSLSETPQLMYTQSTEGLPTVYLFQNKVAGNYMVVSADDIAPALLGYGDNLSQTMNPTMKWWMEEYGRQIQWARNEGAASTPKSKANAQSTLSSISPMTTTRWNQDAPFNNDCPEIGGERAVTGCVATALAQVMKYHNWPAKGTGSNTYTPSSMSNSLTVDFGNTTYDWANMVNVYDASSTTAQKEAVATLMYSCGVAVNMDYTASESSATSFAAAQAMVNYFNYDKGITFYSRNYYSINDWNNLVYNQLKNYGPVQYSGQSNDGGHSFVCDGYSEDGYFHINWGWGGMSDGYFLLTALNPTTQGIGGSTSGYNFDQDIIGNVKPASDSSTSTIVPNFAAQAFEVGSSTASLGSEVSFTGPIYSFSLANVSGRFGLKITDGKGNVTYAEGSPFSNMQPEYGVEGYSVTLPSNLSDGSYKVSPVVTSSTSSESSWLDIPVLVGAENTTSMTVSAGVATFTTQEASKIAVSNINVNTDFYIGSQFEIALTVTNSSNSEYLGGIGLVLINSEDEEVAEGSEYPLDLQAGESNDITYLSGFNAVSSSGSGYAQTSGLSAGTYYICFVDESGNQLSELQQITLNAESSASLSLSDFTISGGTESVDKNNIEFTGNLSVTQGYFGNTLTLVIFPDENTGGSIESVATYTAGPFFLSEGESVNMSVKADFSNGVDGAKYFAMLYNGSNAAVNNRLVFTLNDPTAAVKDMDIAPEAISIEFYTLAGVKVESASGDKAPGLYIVRRTFADGTVTVQKELMK